MDSDTKFIIGAVAVGGIALYLFRDKIGGLFKGATDTSNAIGGVATTAGDAVNSWISLLDLKKDSEAMQNLFGSFLSQMDYKNKLDAETQRAKTLQQQVDNMKRNEPSYIYRNSSTYQSVDPTKAKVGNVFPPQKIVSTQTGDIISNPFSFNQNMSMKSGLPGMSLGGKIYVLA